MSKLLKINTEKCTSCGLCVKVCPINIINMNNDDIPFIENNKEAKCMGCQQCLCICPTGALSIRGKKPENSIPISEIASPSGVEALIKNRRSFRHYKNEDMNKKDIRKLIKIVANAPTGKNANQVRFTLIDNLQDMDKFRQYVYNGIENLEKKGLLPKEFSYYKVFADRFKKGEDIIFRFAPHLLITSSPGNIATPYEDGLIALSYFELMAQSMGIGTVWNGFCMFLMELLPDMKKVLQIPENHIISYCMAFGIPDLKYQRGVQRDNVEIFSIKI